MRSLKVANELAHLSTDYPSGLVYLCLFLVDAMSWEVFVFFICQFLYTRTVV